MSWHCFAKVLFVIIFALIYLGVAESGEQKSILEGSGKSPPIPKTSLTSSPQTDSQSTRKRELISGCIALPRTVNLSANPKSPFFGKCVRIKRCEGGCSSELLGCKPLTIVQRNVSLSIFHKTHNFALRTSRKDETITVEEHQTCGCGCTLQEKDCNENQTYSESTCRCDCKVQLEKDRCSEKFPVLNPNTCKCEPQH